MKHKVTLTITSLLSILFMAFHLTDDIVRGMEPGGSQPSLGCSSWSSGCTERWCSPNGDRGTSSSSSGRSLGRASLSAAGALFAPCRGGPVRRTLHRRAQPAAVLA
jgi:hypothetical protein